MSPRPPYEEPRSPLHPGHPTMGPRIRLYLLNRWVVPSGLIGDERSPPDHSWVNPRSLYRDRSLLRGPSTAGHSIEGSPIPRLCHRMIERPAGLQQPLWINKIDFDRQVEHQTAQKIRTRQN